ncbi:DNA polymerase III subunit epsilon [Enhygromyxa salina]|uniref:DNA polymerase III subunit epsilon n=1 Tax=Enhygromyxa salina TaxID=215803 RepID=A0A2S9XCI1_9BACT|nr:3'-5' exonuclease [Enhygromyxa salina]PRP90510.1 DNA polymerase III subunit epsilon [Enhygromyxa salina]
MSEETATATRVPQIKDLGPRFFEFVQSLDRPIVFLDIEATGTDAMRDRIIEISLLRVSSDPVAIEAPRTWRIDPKQRIPQEASEIHGIYNEDLEGCPSFAELAGELAELLRGADLAGFAIGRLDIRLLKAEFGRTEVELDLSAPRLVDSQVIFHSREPRNLAAAVGFYCGEELEGAHGAEADTIASLKVFAGQLARYDDLPTGVRDLDELSTAVNAAYVDDARRFMWKDGEPAFNFGKLKGKPLRWAAGDPEHRAYLRRLLQGTLEGEAHDVVVEALQGKIRRKG